MQQRERKTKEARQKRVPIGGRRTKLQLSQSDMDANKGFVLRWINDIGGRVSEAVAGGYEFVNPEYATSLGEGAVHEENSDIGARVSKVVDRAKGTRAYLMRIKEEWYEEDQASKEDQLKQVDQALRPADQGGQTIEQGYTPH